ncbi:MAG: serine O-acetyltransferase [Epulopiscium sp.]|nr:serine O-acetyltransferase [Candidatus Epulonipiscium sp.]
MKYLKEEIKVIREQDPAIKSILEVLLYPSLYALLFYRLSHWFYKKRCYFVARFISQMVRWITGIEIHPGAKIGKGVFIDHGMGVVIGETCEIGDYVTIYQGATLGGTGKDTGKRHPTIGDHVMISAGAKILGPFAVGNHARIGAGAVVLQEVPPYSTCVGVPGRIIKQGDKKVNPCESLDQRLPDPVQMEFCKLIQRIEKLEKKIEELTEEKRNLEIGEGQ